MASLDFGGVGEEHQLVHGPLIEDELSKLFSLFTRRPLLNNNLRPMAFSIIQRRQLVSELLVILDDIRGLNIAKECWVRILQHPNVQVKFEQPIKLAAVPQDQVSAAHVFLLICLDEQSGVSIVLGDPVSVRAIDQHQAACLIVHQRGHVHCSVLLDLINQLFLASVVLNASKIVALEGTRSWNFE
jgi:hypothetical protein